MTLGRLISAFGFGADAALTGGFGLLLVVLAARSGSVEEFGQFSLILAVVAAQAALANFGLGTLTYGRAVAHPVGSGRLLGSAIFIVTVFGSSFYAVTLLALSAFADLTTSILYAAAGLRLVGAVGLVMPQHAMARRALGEYLPARHLTILPAMVATVYAYSMGWSLLVFALIWGIEGLLFAFVCAFTLGRRHAKWNSRNRYRSYLAKAAPIAFQSLCVIVYLRFDQIYVGWRFGDSALGLYAAAAKIAEAGNLAFSVLALVVSPSIIKQICRSGKLNRQTFGFLALLAGITLMLSVGALLIGGNLLAFIFGFEYAAAFTILAIYMGSIMFVAYGSIGSRVLASQGVSTAQMMSGAGGALSNVVLSVIFGEMIGLEGIALATVASYALAVFILWQAVLRSTKGMSRFR
ncbi:oligosaccharide flippase family protein [Rhodobacterales bacterium LSUCC0031]|nr:oligosaccharide flippase family protein [Rhodobacterales bacterium LSUCC0031]